LTEMGQLLCNIHVRRLFALPCFIVV
jgi:hypothetical protein